MIKTLLIVLAVMALSLPVLAQEPVTMPDLTGLNLPQAGAALNRLGLRLGTELNVVREPGSTEPLQRIIGQAIPAGTEVEPGTAVDITVLRAANMLLIYDDNDLTLANVSQQNLNIGNLMFNALDGNGASFAASRWGDQLRSNQCMQVWSVGRNGPKGLPECRLIQTWRVTTNRAEHFWTGAGGTTQFSVVQGGVERAVCSVAAGRCEFFFPPNPRTGPVTPYIHFAYTTDRLAIINTSEDRWMAVGQVVVENNFAEPRGATVSIGQPSLFGNPDTLGMTYLLAPDQCLLFTNSGPDTDTPPRPCDVVARLDVGPNVIFWGADFPVRGVTDSQPRTCPAARPERITLCIVPR